MFGRKKLTFYSEIIDLPKEQEIYHKLCMNKCKEYRYYSQWKAHIEALFSQIHSDTRRTDFKAFLRMRERNASSLQGFGLSMITFSVAILIDKFFPDCSFTVSDNMQTSEWIIIIGSFISILIGTAVFVWFMISIGKNILSENRDKAFYSDLLDILDNMEKKEGE